MQGVTAPVLRPVAGGKPAYPSRAILAVASLLLGIAIYMQFTNGAAGDKAWQLLGTQMWLQGKTIYVTTYFDINSPLLNYIYAFIEYIALHCGFADDHVLAICGLCAMAFSIGVCTRIIRFHPQFQDAYSDRYFVLLLGFIFLFLTNPAYFFHREQIFLILVFPYILRWMPSVENRSLSLRLRFLIGCMAGIGFCMKPHCLVVLAAIQLLYFYRRRSLRILFSVENIIIYAASVLYILSILWLAPAYLSIVLPMALQTYAVYSYKKNALFYMLVAGLMLGVPFADFRFRATSPYRRDIYYLLGICAAFAAYALVNNGWGYTYNPLFSAIYLTIGFVLWEYIYLKKQYALQGVSTRKCTFGIRACVADFAVNALLILVFYYQSATYHCEGSGCGMQDALLDEVKAPGRMLSFGSISMEFMPWVGLSRNGAPWQTRFHHLWMLPKFFSADPEFAQSHHWVTDYVSAALAQDLNTNKPDIVFVDDTDDFITVKRHIDLVRYFSTHADFREAWSPYRYVHRIDKCPKAMDGTEIKKRCSYDVYRRGRPDDSIINKR